MCMPDLVLLDDVWWMPDAVVERQGGQSDPAAQARREEHLEGRSPPALLPAQHVVYSAALVPSVKELCC